MRMYHGDATARTAFLTRVDQATDPRDPGVEAQSGAGPTQDLFGTTDPDAIEAEIGMPAVFVTMLDQIVGYVAVKDPAQARELVRRWFAAPAVGADLGPVVTALAITFVDSVLENKDLSADLVDGGMALRNLHRANAAGRAPDRKAWATQRNAMLAISDRLPNSIDKQIAEFLAGLGWPADRSRTVLSDAAGMLCMIDSRSAAAGIGWTNERRQEYNDTMNALLDETGQDGRLGSPDFDYQKLFAERYPELHAISERAFTIQDEAHLPRLLALAEQVIEVFAVAPEPASARL